MTVVVDRQIFWFMLLRLIAATLLLGGTIVYHLYGGEQRQSQFLVNFLYVLITFTYMEALASIFIVRRIGPSKTFLQLQIVWDILFSLAVVYVTGGSESPFSFLFLIVILSSSVFFSRNEIFLVASACAICYGSLVDLQYYGYLPYAQDAVNAGPLATRDFFYAVFLNLVAFFFTALLSSILAERLRQSKSALEKKEVDYRELEKLNRTIVANIASGLLSINLSGRIRLFNNAAVSITGLRFADVYDAEIRQIFPTIDVFDERGMKVVRRGEAQFCRRNGEWCTLGYASTLLMDTHGRESGLLVSFQDLTELKELERNLVRADRLAAIGQMASGMAHEIRNPLASISGSVQLLLELREFDGYQKRLMQIVVKEADRLNLLLTDFLEFAKPKPPMRETVAFAALGDEIIAVSSGDKRFHNIALRVNCPPGATVHADRQQLWQGLWNLLINSAEALSLQGGTIWIGFKADAGLAQVVVEDDGPGIDIAVRGRIFDPFFSTKDHGSGLGLAMVHSIVLAHGGEIDVGGRHGGGARFVLKFPQAAAVSG